jgi:dTDP-4-dehydrorhamnose reductase
MKVLVFGANGQVGSDLVLELEKNKYEYQAYDRSTLDITNKEQLNFVIQKEKPSFIINAAAYTAVDLAEDEKDKAIAVNSTAPGYIAEICEKYKVCLIHISTDYVFDGSKLNEEYSEADCTGPASVYGETKRDGEVKIAEALKEHIILRTSWVFGEYGNNFVKTMLRLSKTNNELRIVSDQVGAPTYAGDISKAILKIIESKEKEYGVFHFCGKPYVSWYEFASAIFVKAKSEDVISMVPKLSAIKSIEFPQKAKRPMNSRLSTNKIEKEYKVKPSNWMKALDNIKDYK